MRMDKMTGRLQAALADAQSIAVGKDHTAVAPVHLIAALVRQKEGSIRPLLRAWACASMCSTEIWTSC